MRLCRSMTLIGLFLVLPHPELRAQNGKADRDRAVAEIKKLGGTVELDTRSPSMPVIGVNLKHTPVIDASLEHLKGLTNLERLFLRDTTVTDDGLVRVKGLTRLEVLELGRTKVTDKGLLHLRGFTKLRSLDLGGTEVTDAGLAHLKDLGSLDTLSLEMVAGVSDRGLMHLKGLTNLRTLNLTGTHVTDAGVRELQKALPKVTITWRLAPPGEGD
jgi:Leucine Rich repeat